MRTNAIQVQTYRGIIISKYITMYNIIIICVVSPRVPQRTLHWVGHQSLGNNHRNNNNDNDNNNSNGDDDDNDDHGRTGVLVLFFFTRKRGSVFGPKRRRVMFFSAPRAYTPYT